MTKTEMTEIFSVMALNYRNAKMFDGGIEKLGPTIELWTVCLVDIDFWTGGQAVIRICKTSVYPPTIAEFRKAAQEVNKIVEDHADEIFRKIRSSEFLTGSLEKMYQALPQKSEARAVIDAMGGPQNLIETHISNGREVTVWRMNDIKATYRGLIRKAYTGLPHESSPMLAGRKK